MKTKDISHTNMDRGDMPTMRSRWGRPWFGFAWIERAVRSAVGRPLADRRDHASRHGAPSFARLRRDNSAGPTGREPATCNPQLNPPFPYAWKQGRVVSASLNRVLPLALFFLSITLFPTLTYAHEAGFWKQFVIIDRGSANEYFGDNLGDNFDGQNLGSWTRGDDVFLNGAEANTWARKDWDRSVEWTRFHYKIGGGSFTSVNLDHRNADGNNDMWDQTAEGIRLTTLAPGTHDLEVYFEGQGRQNWHSYTWLFYDSASPDYKATFTITAVGGRIPNIEGIVDIGTRPSRRIPIKAGC